MTTEQESKAERNRAIVTEFYDLCFVQKRYAEAADRYFGDRYIQHNEFVADGIEGFKNEFVNSERRRSPDYVQRPLRIIADEELVAIHETIHAGPDDRGVVLVDIFRLEDGKIVEHWDVFMPIPDPATVPHDNGVL
ncbi:nuclear transport factor 2 family protein [Streptosporangium saharense]|uniref:nuclear transport factor 2 family protein n=1 Tax=Streptosporangium saharense TaxID=1706840 RepID=UPI00367E42AB